MVNLIKKRSIIYSKATYKINCENLSKNEIVNKVIDIYENVLKLIVNTKSEKYPILIGSNLFPNISKIFKNILNQLSKMFNNYR